MDHKLNSFIDNLDASLSFYNTIPPLYEQAILMYFFNTMQAGLEAYSISNSAKDQFNEFLRIMGGTGNKKDVAQGQLGSLSNSYMYYITYLSPQVTNVKIIQHAY